MAFFFKMIVGMIGNLLTDIKKKILNWQIVSEEPVVVDSEGQLTQAGNAVNHERLQCVQSAFLMLVFCFVFLATAAYLPVVFGNFPSATIDLTETRLISLSGFFSISYVNIYYFVLFMVAVGYIPIFIFTQFLTKTIAWLVNYNFTNVSKSRFVFFFASSLLPVTILFAAAVTYLNYPGLTFWSCFRYSLLITVILLGFSGIQARP